MNNLMLIKNRLTTISFDPFVRSLKNMGLHVKHSLSNKKDFFKWVHKFVLITNIKK